MSLNTPSGSPKSSETGSSPMKTVMALATLVGLSVAGCAKPEASAAPAGATPIKITTYKPDQGPAAGSAWVGKNGHAAGGDQFNSPGTFKARDFRVSLIDMSNAKILSDNDDNDLHGFMGGNAPGTINNPPPIVITGCCEKTPGRGGGRPKPPPAPTPKPEQPCTDCENPEKTRNDAMGTAGGGDEPPVAPAPKN